MIRAQWAKYRGPLGHAITGIVAGACMALGYWQAGIALSGMVMIRQTVGWLSKMDTPDKDMMEHMVFWVASFLVVKAIILN